MFERLKEALQKRSETQAHSLSAAGNANASAKVGGPAAAQTFTGAKQRGKPSKELRNALIGLKFYDKELYDDVVTYVHDGSRPEVLTAIAANTDPEFTHYFTMPGQVTTWFRGDLSFNEKLRSYGMKSTEKGHFEYQYTLLENRRVFYENETDPSRVARMGRVLAQVDNGPNRPIILSPPFVHALVNDFVAVAPDSPNRQAMHFGERSKVTVGLLEAAARAEDSTIGPHAMIELLFQRDTSWWGNAPLPSWISGAGTYVAAHISELDPEAVSKLLSAFGKSDLLKWLQEQPSVRAGAHSLLAVFAGDSAKTVREAAIEIVKCLPPDAMVQELETVVAKLPASRAGTIVDFLAHSEQGQAAIGRLIDSGAKASLLAQRAQEQFAAVTENIEEPELELPPITPLKQVDETALREGIKAFLAREIAFAHVEDTFRRERAAHAQKITDKNISDFIDVCVGRSRPGPNGKFSSLPGISENRLIRSVKQLPFALAVYLLPATGYDSWLLRGKVEPDMDLRAMEYAFKVRGRTDSVSIYYGESGVDAEHAWPWFAQNIAALTELMDSGADGAEKAVDIIDQFPVIPTQVLQMLASRAMGTSKIARKYAQQALNKHPAALALAMQGLEHSTSDSVIAAAQWLGKQKNPEGIAPLTAALAREKREIVRASLLGALTELGADLSEYLDPQSLLAAATKGLKAKIPASLSWFPFDSVPAVRWKNEDPVAPEIIKWWIVSAVKMKSPDGSGIIGIYLQLLHENDRAALSKFVVHTWIARDTVRPSEAEARAYAEQLGGREFQIAQEHLADQQALPDGPHPLIVSQAALPLEHWVRRHYDQKISELVGSAQTEKGLLAFGAGMPGVDLANAFHTYNRNFKSRRAQIDALVTSLYGNGQPQALQALMSVARRHHQRTVQENANTLVERVAEERGWTTDELADRTIPTVGFDDDGVLRLSFGEREFTGRMTQSGLIELSNPAGKTIKTLPKATASDDPELAAESRKQLSSSRKEIKTLLGIQTSRLYEAMCAERDWSAEDWTQYLRNHPVMARLISRLVWVATTGGEAVLFRPTDDGELLSIDDEPIEFPLNARITLAHAVAVSDQQAAQWQQHLTDYEIVPLFDQFSHALPEFGNAQTVFDNLQGHMTDSYSFRGVVTKRGYQRGLAEDAGWFYSYTKDFRQLGLTAQLDFTGAFLPEEDITCATRTLSFKNRRGVVPLADVPKVLVAEAYSDYEAVAALGAFDPDWERKSEY